MKVIQQAESVQTLEFEGDYPGGRQIWKVRWTNDGLYADRREGSDPCNYLPPMQLLTRDPGEWSSTSDCGDDGIKQVRGTASFKDDRFVVDRTITYRSRSSPDFQYDQVERLIFDHPNLPPLTVIEFRDGYELGKDRV
ncbi:MAG: hypothetical protein ACLGH3_07020 [Actinomycetota bacterium]